MEDLFLGIDIGSSRAKAFVADAHGRRVAEAERPQQIARPEPGRAEQDPEGDWWESLVALCHAVEPEMARRVAGVGVAALGPCVAVADGEARPLRPAILYGIDTRAECEIADLTARYGSEAILGRCGSPLSTQSVGPKLLWLRRHEPATWAQTRLLFTAGSYLVHRLTGEYVMDHHSASQAGPLYDVRENAWIDRWWDDIAPRLRRPRLAWAQEVLGRLTAEAASTTGLPEGIPVAAGTIDSWAEAAASGLRRPGEALLVYGTTLFLIEVHTTAGPHPRLWSTTGFGPGSRNLAAGTSSAGALLTWLRRLAGGDPLERLIEEAAAAGPGAGGLLALPYFAGERTPLLDPEARGLLLGLTVSHDRGHVLRALLEGTGFAVRHNLDTMREAGSRITGLRASGGGTQSPLWPQIVSDVTGLPQTVLSGEGGGSRGAALLAAVAAGAADLETGWPQGRHTVRPVAGTRPLYDELYGLYREVSDVTRPAAHLLARLQSRHSCEQRMDP